MKKITTWIANLKISSKIWLCMFTIALTLSAFLITFSRKYFSDLYKEDIYTQTADSLNGTFVVPTKFLCFPISKIHWKTELYVLQESAIWLLLLVNVHLFHKAVKKFFLLRVGELTI